MAIYHPPSSSQIEGSTFIEVIAVITVVPMSLWLLTCALSSSRLIASRTGNVRLAIESAIVFLPFIILCTLLGDYVILNILSPILLLVLAFYILNCSGEAYMFPKWTEFLFIAKPKQFTQVIDDVSLRSNFNLIATTCICILAVDFEHFPSKFTKCNIYGFSVMDVGIGAFVAVNALISTEARAQKPVSQELSLAKAIVLLVKSNSPLLLIGVSRTLFISLSGYNQNPTEYGVHWNSFFTIALVKIIGSVIHRFVTGVRALALAIVMTTAHQVYLTHGGSDFIKSSDRSNLFQANKEGILSLPGFVAIYIISLEMGSRWYRMFILTTKSMLHVTRLFEASLIALASLAVTLLCHQLIEPNSRRQANSSYVAWSICIVSYTFAIESLMKLVTEFTVGLGLLQEQKLNNSPRILKSFMSHAFLTFMLANLFTGIINMLYSAINASFFTCISILYIYIYTLSVIGDQLLNVKLANKLKMIMNNPLKAKSSVVRTPIR